MNFDVIVLGTGGVGSAAAYHLASRGVRVLGLDRFPGGHDRGSSHGETRVIRQAYFEHADYVPLAKRSYELWHELEADCGEQLLHQVGLLQVGPPDGIVVPGVLASARLHGLSVDTLNAAEVTRRFPGFVAPEGHIGVFEPVAGYLRVERCVLAHLAGAKKRGAELRTGESVIGWQSTGDRVVVQTDRARYEAAKLVITAGPWAGSLLAELGIPLRVLRKHVHWFRTADTKHDRNSGCPTYLYETSDGIFYGFPRIDDRGLKVGEHSGGAEIQDPLLDNRSPEEADTRRVTSFVQQHMPGVTQNRLHHSVCYYTMSPDENFLIDHHPNAPNVCFTAGLSGHGFKFTSVLGQVMTDLTLDGQSKQPVEFLRVGRLGQKSFASHKH